MSSKEEIISATNMVKRALFKVSAVETPPPDSSQGTKDAYRTFLTSTAQAGGQILDFAVGLGQSATDEDGNPLDLDLTSWCA